MKTLTELFDINNGDVVSIVGTGGKTSLLFKLGNELRKNCRVLITTSTKIFMPSKEDYDFIFTMEEYMSNKISIRNGATVVIREYSSEENKLIGIGDEDLEKLIDDFDVILIEADGSMRLPLKAWKDNEPPILRKTTKSIGVFPVDMIGEKINRGRVYNYEEFIRFAGGVSTVDFKTVGKICSDTNGIFKNSRGSLYLYLNKADDTEKVEKARELAAYLKENVMGSTYDFKICAGSLKEGVFYEC